MNVRFITLLGGNVFEFSKEWKLPFFPQVGQSIEVLSLLTETEKERAEKIIFMCNAEKRTFLSIFVDGYATTVKHILWYADMVEIELVTKNIIDDEVQILECICEDISDKNFN